jgi:hypothetical protein
MSYVEGERYHPPLLEASSRNNQWNEDAAQKPSCNIKVQQPRREEVKQTWNKANMEEESNILGSTRALYNPMSDGAVANPSSKLKANGRPYLDKARIISNSACRGSRR